MSKRFSAQDQTWYTPLSVQTTRKFKQAHITLRSTMHFPVHRPPAYDPPLNILAMDRYIERLKCHIVQADDIIIWGASQDIFTYTLQDDEIAVWILLLSSATKKILPFLRRRNEWHEHQGYVCADVVLERADLEKFNCLDDSIIEAAMAD
ncbi:uncharacterized protein BDZ99DRAFT_523795 [Mytilinidion resinicola]|uniref:Uncharacterized protein n=1 Tax=Mytilinidion resinicola TaxID=574789 RepID=A0A6A6YCA6_9PEZI|nr:uncharacterized protein BDZ99DRAFT_523795 [Mytilinidion resinicola]KAF2806340.1 hypothetical protein BDZ99DRAFT_523795 [Mytilinidion resinicola]